VRTGAVMTLSIGMATYDDYDGVYFTVMALRLYHPEIAADSEIIVVDNHPDGPCAPALKALESWVPGYLFARRRVSPVHLRSDPRRGAGRTRRDGSVAEDAPRHRSVLCLLCRRRKISLVARSRHAAEHRATESLEVQQLLV
jgi:hypothetical protein